MDDLFKKPKELAKKIQSLDGSTIDPRTFQSSPFNKVSQTKEEALRLSKANAYKRDKLQLRDSDIDDVTNALVDQFLENL